MRAPPRSFKDELVAFRANRKTTARPADSGPLGIGNRNSADTQLLDRWLADERTNDIWQKIRRRAPNLVPADFIQAVLNARRSAVASVNRRFGTPGSGKHKKFATLGWAGEWSRLKQRLANLRADLGPLKIA